LPFADWLLRMSVRHIGCVGGYPRKFGGPVRSARHATPQRPLVRGLAKPGSHAAPRRRRAAGKHLAIISMRATACRQSRAGRICSSVANGLPASHSSMALIVCECLLDERRQRIVPQAPQGVDVAHVALAPPSGFDPGLALRRGEHSPLGQVKVLIPITLGHRHHSRVTLLRGTVASLQRGRRNESSTTRTADH
jgi:hypothetical protein